MVIYPAIDIQNGKCVMLKQGRADNKTVYGNDPVEIGLKWERKGAEYVHIVDLDGAIFGEDRGNLNIIKDMRQHLKIPMQVGGGIRDSKKISYLLDEIGVDRVIVGTLAVKNSTLLSRIAKRYPGQIAVSIDAQDGFVAIKGWTESSSVDAIDLCHRLSDMGIDTIIYTDIARDGMLKGPNIEFSKRIIARTNLEVIVSGGITTLDDIQALMGISATGAIIGKGLYDGRIDLQKAIQTAKEAL